MALKKNAKSSVLTLKKLNKSNKVCIYVKLKLKG